MKLWEDLGFFIINVTVYGIMCIFFYINILLYFSWLNIISCKKLCGSGFFNFFYSALNIWRLNFFIYEIFLWIFGIYIFHVIHNLWFGSFNIWKHVDEFSCFLCNKLNLNKLPIIRKYYCYKMPNQFSLI
jgi:hypothetical protein